MDGSGWRKDVIKQCLEFGPTRDNADRDGFAGFTTQAPDAVNNYSKPHTSQCRHGSVCWFQGIGTRTMQSVTIGRPMFG